MAADAGQLFRVHPARSEKISKAIAKLDREARAVFILGVLGDGARHLVSDEFNHTFWNTPLRRERFA